MGLHTNSTTALDAIILIHCDCGKDMRARLGRLKTQTLFPCDCGAVVTRDLRDFVAQIEEVEAHLTRRGASVPPLVEIAQITAAGRPARSRVQSPSPQPGPERRSISRAVRAPWLGG